MKQQSSDPLERFSIANTNVKIDVFVYANRTRKWGVYGHPQKYPLKWTRIAGRDTQNEAQAFCESWGLNIVEDTTA